MKWHQGTFGLKRDREQKEVSLRAWEALEMCAEGRCRRVHCPLHVCNIVFSCQLDNPWSPEKGDA